MELTLFSFFKKLFLGLFFKQELHRPGDAKMPDDSHATRNRGHAEDLDLDLDGRTWTFWIAGGPESSGSRLRDLKDLDLLDRCTWIF